MIPTFVRLSHFENDSYSDNIITYDIVVPHSVKPHTILDALKKARTVFLDAIPEAYTMRHVDLTEEDLLK